MAQKELEKFIQCIRNSTSIFQVLQVDKLLPHVSLIIIQFQQYWNLYAQSVTTKHQRDTSTIQV
jgi:hypothetical protein